LGESRITPTPEAAQTNAWQVIDRVIEKLLIKLTEISHEHDKADYTIRVSLVRTRPLGFRI